MKKVIVSLVLGVCLLSPMLFSEEPSQAEKTKGAKSNPTMYFEKTMKLRVFEGLKEGGPPPAESVSSSFLKYRLTANIQADADLAEEQGQIKKTFNLKGVKLLTESSLKWEKGGEKTAHHVFRLDGNSYEIALGFGDAFDRQFRIEVYELKETQKANLLDTEFIIPRKNIAVFGFEDSLGKPYFLSLREEARAVVTGSSELNKPPRLIKKVNPVYPQEARKAGKQGIVILRARTDTFGRVEDVKVEKSVDPILDQAASDALKQWVYEPAVVEGKPHSVEFTVTMRFTLADEKAGVAAGVAGGVVGGVQGGVSGGVEGQVEGGVQGGVMGGVQGGVAGGVEGGVQGGQESEEMLKKRQEFEKDAVRCKGDIKPPKLIKLVNPVYPETARQAGIEGVVIIEARTDIYGRVKDAMILRSIPALDKAALDAVRQWVYEPLILDGKPREALFTVTVRFALDEKDIEKFAEGAVKVKGEIKPPKLIKIVEPVYPEEARQAGVEGVVIVQARTDIYGRVKDAMILRSIPALNKAALDAVRQWVYEPIIVEGTPKEAVFTVTVRFGLDEKEKAELKKKAEGQKAPEQEAVKATGELNPPKIVKKVEPVYPEAAHKAGIEGIVILEAMTDNQGNVVRVKVLKSIPELDQAAIDALKQWKYEPMIIEGKPTGIVFTVTIKFALD